MGGWLKRPRARKRPVVDPHAHVARFSDVAQQVTGARGLPRVLLVQVQLPGRALRIERENVTERHVYFINDQEVTVNEYLIVTQSLMKLK